MDFTESESREVLRDVAGRYGTPTFVYFFDQIRDRVARLRRAFGERVEISYAVKANPNRELLRRLRPLVDRLDVSSGGELLIAGEADWPAGGLTFVGPAKAAWELELALERDCGSIVVESTRELEQLSALAGRRSCRVVLRINPRVLPKGFGVSMSRRPTGFGIDEEDIDSAISAAGRLPNISLQGFHVFAGTQCLANESLVENFRNTARLYRTLLDRHDLTATLLIFGSGFGIPYHEGDQPIDLETIAAGVEGELTALRSHALSRHGSLALELGRYLVGEAGIFLTSVVGVKHTRGTRIAILNGGMNHYAAAAGNLGSVVKRNFPIQNLSKPTGETGLTTYDLAGPLCTNIDALGRAVALAPLEHGDVIAIGCAGAYGLTASPLHFISHPPPREVLVSTEAGAHEFMDVSGFGPAVTPPPWPRHLLHPQSQAR